MNTVIRFRKSDNLTTIHAARRYVARLERYPMLPRERRIRHGFCARVRAALARLGIAAGRRSVSH